MLDSIRQALHRAVLNLYALRRSKFVRDTITLQAGAMTLMLINVASFVVVVRVLGPEEYGAYQLVLTMYGLLMTLNLTGLGPSTVTRLAEAIGARDIARARDLMGFFIQVAAATGLIAWGIAILFGPALAADWYDNPQIGQLLQVYVLVLFFNPLYQFGLITLQSTRAMRSYTLLENAASLGEAVLRLAAALLWGGAAAIVIAHVFAEGLKGGGGLLLYLREQRRRPEVLPRLRDVLAVVPRNSPRPYWRFGFSMALDKSVAAWFVLLPVQAVAMRFGEAEAGFLRLGLSALSYPAILFSGILTNLETRLPADAGQRNYVRLADNFRRVMRIVIPVALLIYGAFALFAPLLVPVLGEEYLPAMAVIRVLCIYGVITAVGGAFGPLYRTLRLVPAMLAAKIAALLLTVPAGAILIEAAGAVGGAWAVNIVFALSVGMTMIVVLRRLWRLAAEQRAY